MDEDFKCPQCASRDWMAVEQFTSLTPCTISKSEDDWELNFDMRAEMAREAATSVVLAYTCATPECGFTIPAEALAQGGGYGNG